MDLGLRYHQLKHVANTARAGVVRCDTKNPVHVAGLRYAIPRFLGQLNAVHGTEFSRRHLDSVMRVISAGDIQVDFFLVALDMCQPVQLAGLSTFATTFEIEPDAENDLVIFPTIHGEDICVDDEIARQFRAFTRTPENPNGIGAGTWFMGEQILHSVSDPDWTPIGRDNEHFIGNVPIEALMGKYGALPSTPEDSAVFHMHGMTPDMESRFDLGITAEDLPADALGLTRDENNFVTRWSSPDGTQQIAVVYRRLGSTSDGSPLVWSKIKSNGNLPSEDVLKDVLKSLFAAGIHEIESPERCWGLPRNYQGSADGFYRKAVGYPAPELYIHAHNEPGIVQALRAMQFKDHVFGLKPMHPGKMILARVPNPVATLGCPIPSATRVPPLARGKTGLILGVGALCNHHAP